MNHKKLNVSFHGNFWSKALSDKAIEEIPVHYPFSWSGEAWQVFSVFGCKEGIILDYGFCVEPERIRAFLQKWRFLEQCGEEPDEEQMELMEAQNPLEAHAKPELIINGKIMAPDHSCGLSWIPEGVFTAQRDDVAETLMYYYDLDKALGWHILRTAFVWEKGFSWEPGALAKQALSLTLKAERENIAGPHFMIPGTKDLIFNHPSTGCQHKLKVLDYHREISDIRLPKRPNLEIPQHFWRLSYTVTPSLSSKAISVRDCARGDAPQRPTKKQWRQLCGDYRRMPWSCQYFFGFNERRAYL